LATYFWVGGSNSANWSNSTYWATSTGGTGGHGPPTFSDTATFDANSGTGTCTAGGGTYVGNLITTGYQGTLAGVIFLFNTTSGAAIGATIGTSGTYTGLTIEVYTSNNANTCTLSIASQISGLYCAGSASVIINLTTNLTLNGNLQFNSGTYTFNSNNHNITFTGTGAAFYAQASSGTATVNLGTSNLYFNNLNTTYVISMNNASSANFILNASSSAWYLQGALTNTSALPIQLCSGLTLGNVIITGRYYSFQNNGCTFTNLSINTSGNSSSYPTVFLSGATYTITGTLRTNGSSGALVYIQGSSAGTHFTFTSTTTPQSVNYVSLRDSYAAGVGTTWYAGANSTNVSDNSGWTFTTNPPGDNIAALDGIPWNNVLSFNAALINAVGNPNIVASFDGIT
jgi:hypothetical protein